MFRSNVKYFSESKLNDWRKIYTLPEMKKNEKILCEPNKKTINPEANSLFYKKHELF